MIFKWNAIVLEHKCICINFKHEETRPNRMPSMVRLKVGTELTKSKVVKSPMFSIMSLKPPTDHPI